MTRGGRAVRIPRDTDTDELHRRVAQALARSEVELLHLADGRGMLVNWRSVRTVLVGPAPRPAPP